MCFGFDKGGVKVECDPGIFFVNIAANRISVIDGQKTPLLEKTLSLSHTVGEEQLHFAPIAVRPRDAVRPADHVGHIFPRAVDGCHIQFTVHQHRCQAFVRWYTLEGYSRRGSEDALAAMDEL